MERKNLAKPKSSFGLHMPVIYGVLSICVNRWDSSAGLYPLSAWQFRTSEADGTLHSCCGTVIVTFFLSENIC